MEQTTQAKQEKVGLISRLFLLWSGDYASISYHGNIKESDMVNLQNSEALQQIIDRWNSYWEQSVSEGLAQDGSRLKWTIRKTFSRQIISSTVINFIAHQSYALMPLLIYYISEYIQQGHFTTHSSILYLSVIFGLSLIKIFCLMHADSMLKNMGSNIFSCLCYLVTDKSLKRNDSSKRFFTVGQIANLTQYDCAKLLDYPFIFAGCIFQFYSFLFVLGCTFFVSGWIGLASCMILFILQMTRYFMNSIFKKYQKQVHAFTSKRLIKSSEMINSIKYIKVNALENKMYEQLQRQRQEQINKFRSYLNLGVISNVFQKGATRIGIFVYVIIYVLMGNPLSSVITFTLLLFYNYMSLNKFVEKINNIEDIDISIGKIEEFLSNQERDSSYMRISQQATPQLAVEISKASFNWDKAHQDSSKDDDGLDPFNLENINMKIKKGQFVALVGEFGSGKSSLLSAILGEMNCSEGSVTVNGSVAYADQNPWILNDTVRSNILFGEPFNEKQYQSALHYSRLQTDLSLFAEGDATMIGERGSTLSGGQRARISLARAFYKNADIYLLDDVLSALDAQVTASIFKQTLAKHLKGKTIILATHLLNYLKLVNKVYEVVDGQIVQVLDNLNRLSINRKQSITSQNRRSLQYKRQSLNFTSPYVAIQQQQKNTVSIFDPQTQDQVFQWELFKLFLNRRGGKIYVFAVLLFMVLLTATNVASFKYLNYWVNQSDNTERKYFWIYSIILSSNLIVIAVHIIVEHSAELFQKLHEKMIKNMLIAPMFYFQSVSSSKLINKLSGDLKKVDNEIIPKFRNTVSAITILLTFIYNILFAYFESKDYIVAGGVIITIVIIVYCYYYFMIALKRIHKLDQNAEIPIYSCFAEILSGSSTIRAYCKETYMKNKHKKIMQAYRKVANIRAGVDAYFTAVVSLLTVIMTTLLFVKMLLFRDEDKSIDFFLIYNMFSFEKMILNVHGGLSEFLSNLKYLGYCDQLTKIPQEEGYALISKGENDFDFGKEVDSSWIQRGQIDFNQFSVRYRPQLEDVLKEITLNIRPGEKIGVVGRTGSGKSTTIMSLLRMLQTHSGNITIDGKDIYARDLQSLRAGFSVILQEHFLFSGTVRENIDPLNVFADLDIIAALQRCGLWENLQERSGLLTSVEEGGDNFSGGERQLINIARTLLDPKKVVLVDEATASIDYKSDEMLQKVIRDQFASCTVITIAHRITTILTSDRILVLDKGRIVELDSPQNLLKDPNSAFFKLYKESRLSQSMDYRASQAQFL